jgi:hypothetical protein
VFTDEGASVGPAEQEQCFGELDRSRVHGVEAVDELAVVPVRIVAGHIQQRLRDRQRGAQFVGGIGCEPLLFGDLCLEPREHGVEGVGELAELVIAAFQPDPVGERSRRGRACGVRDTGQWSEHPAGEKPPSHETEHQEEGQYDNCRCAEDAWAKVGWVEDAREVGEPGNEAAGGIASQEEHPDGREHQGTGDHEEADVAQGELEANAESRLSIHALLSLARHRVKCRCGTRRRPPWR